MQLSRGELVVVKHEAAEQRRGGAASAQQADGVDIREEAVQAVTHRQQRSETLAAASADHDGRGKHR